MRIPLRCVTVAALASTLVANPAIAKGPPWISIELPVNPYDQSQRGAFLLVHSFHHGTAIGYIVTGTAEGIVNGERRTVKLEFAETGREGGQALRQNWPEEGTWTLAIKANQGPDDAATAVVDLGPDGTVAAVGVPTMHRGPWTLAAPVPPGGVVVAAPGRAC